jgi:SAM-dependent methyltransferase
MSAPEDQRALATFYEHQDLLLPHTGALIGPTNLDIGCGSGIASVIHAERLGTQPSLCDVIDIRHPRARAFPFRTMSGTAIPFADGAFASGYLQYILHHVPDRTGVRALLAEAARVAPTTVIVEEVIGPATDVARAKAFDRDMNEQLHPGVAMPVYDYFTPPELAQMLADVGRPVTHHSVVFSGNNENGFLETHVFAGRSNRTSSS